MAQGHRNRDRSRGFTLIELLVVIAIIALLIGILLPSLSSARKSAWAVIAGTNARSVVQASTIYQSENKDTFPPSYVYAAERQGFEWRIEDQRENHPDPINGYLHWSYFLFNNGELPQDAFESPAVLNRGAPRSNPGPDELDWEPEQVNDMNQPVGGDFPEDRQVPRLAFAANAAVMPRNKFVLTGTNRRTAKLVKGNKIYAPARVIMLGEFRETSNWQSLAGQTDSAEGAYKIKSHRPITPFKGFGAGARVFQELDRGSNAQPSFSYPTIEELTEELKSINDRSKFLLDGQGGSNTSLGAVADHHNGKSNFAFVDGHVSLMTVLETVEQQLWGDRFYSMSGGNKVDQDGEFGYP
jgi:prepilin-type N-terminal cleavage/methylation domain-containing protein/prepilin-type processing-associated H-X9-DG protein